MNKTIVKNLGLLSMSLAVAAFGTGCSTGAAPVQEPGNIGANGALKWYVDAKGGSTYGNGRGPASAFNTIQAAAAVALAGDTVEVMDGTYTNGNGVVLDIKTAGSPTGYITYEAAPGAHPVIQLGPGAYNAVVFESTAAYIVFQGFTVMGNSQGLTLAGAQAASKSPTAPANVIYQGNCITSTGINAAPSTNPSEPHHIKVLNNVVAYCGAVGIGLGYADYVQISGNTVYNNAWFSVYGPSGISINTSYDTLAQDVPAPTYRTVITNNTLYGNEEFIPWGKVGYISDGEGIIIDTNGNSQYDSNIKFPAYTGRTQIANNVIYNGGSGAIEVLQSGHVDVVNNSTFNNNLNQATEPGRGELSLSYLSDIKVYNNVFQSSDGGITVSLGKSPGCPATCFFDYNLFNGGAAALNGLVSFGAHDIVSVSPMYTNIPKPTLTGVNTPVPTDLINAPTGVNLMLLPGSPAIGKGTSTVGPGGPPVPATDILGKPRPSANGYTMGAYSQ